MEKIFNLTLNELENKCSELKLKKFTAKQVFKWIYKKNIFDVDKMSDISNETRTILKKNFDFSLLKIITTLVDEEDGTTKLLLETNDNERIETVLMKFNHGNSICVSTQIGCNMGCKFCASGLLKKKRNLEPSEIVLQLLTMKNYLNNININNIVYMGIGEPFDNYDNVKKSINIINDPFGLEIGSRKITVSTCGLCEKIITFANDFKQISLAISLHAPNDQIRKQIMPIANAYSIDKLISTLCEYQAITNKRITIEYLMLADINDSPENAKELANLLNPISCYVNLIPYNKNNELPFKRSERIKEFMNILSKNKIVTTVRLERGLKINAACGQLRSQYEK